MLTLPKTAALIECLRRSSNGYLQGRTAEPLITLQDLGALVIAAGSEAGFVVAVEVPVPITRPRSKPQQGKLDCCWYALGRDATKAPVVVWEFDGRDVARAHVVGVPTKRRIGTIEKLRGIGAPIKCQGLYTYRDGNELGPRSTTTEKALKAASITVIEGGQLLRANFLAKLAGEAATEARRLGLNLLSASATRR